jgi:hypothetical protein
MPPRKKKDHIENYVSQIVEFVSLDLTKFISEEGDTFYGVTATYHLETDEEGIPRKGIPLVTEMIGDCKHCLINRALDSLSELYEVSTHVMIFDENGELEEEIDANDTECINKTEDDEELFDIHQLVMNGSRLLH